MKAITRDNINSPRGGDLTPSSVAPHGTGSAQAN